MVVACLVKEIQICTELRKMAEMGLIQSEVVRERYCQIQVAWKMEMVLNRNSQQT